MYGNKFEKFKTEMQMLTEKALTITFLVLHLIYVVIS